MDYEQKYKEALEKARQFSEHPLQEDSSSIVEYIFPELQGIEDEKIRKWLIDWAKAVKWSKKFTISKKQVLAWLEKQGEQKPTDTCDSLIIKSKEFPASEKRDFGYFNEPTDNVEPKFKVEEEKWYVCTQTYVLRGKIVVIKGQTYQAEKDNVIKGEDGCLFIDRHDGKASEYFRYWTIQDAKDGDVLACNEEILLFKSYSVQGRISLYCWYNGRTNNFHSKEVVDTLMDTRNKICPATKEQRDLLFQKMHEDGYTFDFEKKEVKKN